MQSEEITCLRRWRHKEKVISGSQGSFVGVVQVQSRREMG